jgi:hypothetical protein
VNRFESANGFVVAHVETGKCEACGEVRRGLSILPASNCWMNICAHCIADMLIATLPGLAPEFIKWGKQ